MSRAAPSLCAQSPSPAPSPPPARSSPAEVPGALKIQQLHCAHVCCLLGLLMYVPVLNLEAVLGRDSTEYVAVWTVQPKVCYE